MVKNLLFLFLVVSMMLTGCTRVPIKKISIQDYRDKVYASWVAQCIGNIYGLPHENRYLEEPGPENFPYGYGRNAERLKEINGAFSDDDTDFEYMYLLAMEKYGVEPSYRELTDSWLYHVRERVWLANRAALGAMHFGFTPPVTGMREYNPHWFQIDPQLVNEIWAVTSPGMIKYAAQKSAWAAQITDDSWGVEPTIHYGAMFAAAFFESDIIKLVDIGTAALPPNSRFAQTVEDMKALYQRYPTDWKKARQEMARKYYDQEPIDTKTIWNANLNGACGILALLYGGGDFQRTLDLACAIGFDADNQAATMSGLLGVVVGTKGLPQELLYPFPQLKWQKPLNDFYKNVTRYDMPDAGLQDMAMRMAMQGEKIILQNGGRKVTENGREVYLINCGAEFSPPLELPSAPGPFIEVNQNIDFPIVVVGGKTPLQWSVTSGQLPPGLELQNGKIVGMTAESGVYPVTVRVQSGDESASQEFVLVSRARNLAPLANEIIANVREPHTAVRDSMWLTVGRSLYAQNVSIINNGKRLGDGSTFYSIDGGHEPKVDYYGYRWQEVQSIGLIGFHAGSVEENGGWFTSLNVEVEDANGVWTPVEGLIISPNLLPGNEPFNKAHFIEYLLAFQPVTARAVRIVGDAGNANHWRSKRTYFTSISELTVHGALPGYQTLPVK